MLILNVILLYKTLNPINLGYKENNKIYNLSSNIVNHTLKESYLTNGRKISNIELMKLNGEAVQLSSYYGNENTLIFIYSEISCNICTDSLIVNCNKLVEYNNITSILGIAYSRRKDYLNRFIRINNIKFPILWDYDNQFIKGNNLKLLPAVLIINKDGIVINSFYLNPNINALSESFFEAAKILLQEK